MTYFVAGIWKSFSKTCWIRCIMLVTKTVLLFICCGPFSSAPIKQSGPETVLTTRIFAFCLLTVYMWPCIHLYQVTCIVVAQQSPSARASSRIVPVFVCHTTANTCIFWENYPGLPHFSIAAYSDFLFHFYGHTIILLCGFSDTSSVGQLQSQYSIRLW